MVVARRREKGLGWLNRERQRGGVHGGNTTFGGTSSRSQRRNFWAFLLDGLGLCTKNNILNN